MTNDSYVCQYKNICSSYRVDSMKCSFLYKFCPLKRDFEEEDERLRGIELEVEK